MFARRQRNLKEIVKEKVREYQMIDNPEPKTKWEMISRLFAQGGKSGRIRAKALLHTIEQINDSRELHDKIMDETLSKSGLLVRSTLLRRRVLKGLCEHLKVNMNLLIEQATTNMMIHNDAAMAMNSTDTHSVEEELEPLMVQVVKGKTKWSENHYDADSDMLGAIELNVRPSR